MNNNSDSWSRCMFSFIMVFTSKKKIMIAMTRFLNCSLSYFNQQHSLLTITSFHISKDIYFSHLALIFSVSAPSSLIIIYNTLLSSTLHKGMHVLIQYFFHQHSFYFLCFMIIISHHHIQHFTLHWVFFKLLLHYRKVPMFESPIFSLYYDLLQCLWNWFNFHEVINFHIRFIDR